MRRAPGGRPSIRTIGSLAMLVLVGCSTGFQFRGDLFMRADQYDRAIDYYEAARPAHRTNAALHRKLGLAYIKATRFEEALEPLSYAHELQPESGATMLYTGLAYEGLGQIDDAIDAYRSYTRLGRFSAHKRKIQARLRALALAKDQIWALERVAFESELSSEIQPENTIAVVSLRVSAGEEGVGSLGDAMASQLATDLSAVRRLSLLERVRIDAVLRELDLTARGDVDATSSPRVGRLVGARRIVSGEVFVLADDGLRADLSVIDVATGDVAASVTTSGTLSTFFDMQKDICFDLLDALGIEPSPAEREDIQHVPTRSLGAFLAYGSGVALTRRGQAADARAAYRRAREEDPGFTIPPHAIDAVDALEQTVTLDPLDLVVAEVIVLEDPYYYPDPEPVLPDDVADGIVDEDPTRPGDGTISVYTPPARIPPPPSPE